MTDEFLEMADGNRRLADSLYRSLAELADSKNEKLREMAKAVLNDGASVRELALSDTYGEELGSAFSGFWDRYQSMSDAERAELAELGERQLYSDDQLR